MSPHVTFKPQITIKRAGYRIRQVIQTLLARPTSIQLNQAQNSLTPEEFNLFLTMQPGEQAHSLYVFEQLKERGHTQPNLLAAALLHDVGKTRFPLKLWERILIVLAQALFSKNSGRLQSLGQDTDKPAFWRKAFIVSRWHAEWSAEMAAQSGSSALTVSLIRRHQDNLPDAGQSQENHLLSLLQAADDEN